MSKGFRKLFTRKSIAKEPIAPPSRPIWKAVLTYDPQNPQATNLQFLDDAQVNIDEVVFALGNLRDVALVQKGAALAQQQIAAQRTPAPSPVPVPVEPTPATVEPTPN